MTRFALYSALILLYSCSSDIQLPESLQIDNVQMEGLSIRAIQALDEDICWFSGSNGSFGYTMDGGLLWSVDSIPEAKGMELRSIAVQNDSTVFVMTVGSPALIFRTSSRGKKWTEVYRNESEDVFFDSMKFWDTYQGIAFGDPNNGCFHILTTRDGGNTWQRVSCERLPDYVEGEAAFAASNTNIKCFGQEGWIITGGTASRLLYTADRGSSWSVYPTPIHQGGEMTGGFSMDMWDGKKGVVIGGNWEEPEDNSESLIRTLDGGKNWTLIKGEGTPGYRSCIQYVPGYKGNWLLAIGYPGMDLSADGGESWKHMNDEKWFSFSFSPTGRRCFLAGPGKLGSFSLERD